MDERDSQEPTANRVEEQPWLDNDEGKHLDIALQVSNAHASVDHISRGLALIAAVLEKVPQPWELTFSNDLSGIACFGRAFRGLRASFLLLLMGHYSEVGGVLRGVYEAAALGRLLAHEPEHAERWLREGTWFPDKVVRKWFRDDGTYQSIYSFFSASAHPTAQSCLPVLIPNSESYSVQLHSEYDKEVFDSMLRGISATTVFVAFALRNAAPSERALPATWRKALSDLAKEAAPTEELSHLERDWEAEAAEWEQLAIRARGADELESFLEEHPQSWKNLNRSGPGRLGRNC